MDFPALRRVWAADLRLAREGRQRLLLVLLAAAAFALGTYILTRVFSAEDDVRIFYPLSGSLSELSAEAPELARPLATMMRLWVWELPVLGIVDLLSYRRIVGRGFPLETMITQVAAQSLYIWVWPFTLGRGLERVVGIVLGVAARLLEHVPTLVHLHGSVALVIAAAVADFTYYWTHRIGHSVRVFWNLGHIGHHRVRDVMSYAAGAEPSSRLLNFVGPANVFRLVMAMFLSKLLTTDVRGAVPAIMFFLALEFWLNPAHSPVLWLVESRVPALRWARWVFATPGLHALHHSRAPEHNLADGCNFAARFSIWDRLFGTYAEPSVDAPIPEMGLFDPETDYCEGSAIRYLLRPYVRLFLELRRNHVRHWPNIFFGHAGWEPPVPTGISH